MGTLAEDKRSFSQTHEIKSYNTDWNQELKISSMFRFFQDIAGDHMGEFGMNYNQLKADGVVFLINSIKVKILKPVMLFDKIRVKTWHCGIKGVRFMRNSVIESQSGERMVECATDWVLADAVTHRVRRPDSLEKIALVPDDKENALDLTAKSVIHFPENIRRLYDRRVNFSDIDYNHHLNNTVYADIVTDCLGRELVERRIDTIQIVYSAEAGLDDVISLYRADDGDRILIKGERDGSRCFEAAVTLKQG